MNMTFQMKNSFILVTNQVPLSNTCLSIHHIANLIPTFIH